MSIGILDYREFLYFRFGILGVCDCLFRTKGRLTNATDWCAAKSGSDDGLSTAMYTEQYQVSRPRRFALFAQSNQESHVESDACSAQHRQGDGVEHIQDARSRQQAVASSG